MAQESPRKIILPPCSRATSFRSATIMVRIVAGARSTLIRRSLDQSRRPSHAPPVYSDAGDGTPSTPDNEVKDV
jgi:hypothetical protein